MAFSFGQSSAGQGGFSFGSSNTGGSLFGSSTPAFGSSQSSSGFSFGQPQSSASLFGSAPTPATQSSLFGGAASSSGFSFGSSLFGASSAAQSQSLFGSSSSSGFGFGGLGQPAQQSAGALGFPNSQSQLVPSGFNQGLAAQPDFSALKELEAIASAYEPNSGKFKFNYLFLNVVDQPAARVKPADVDELQWRAALQRAGGPDNPDRLWPVQAKGFKDLLARKQAQEDALKEYASRLEAAESAARHLERRQETLIKERINAVRRKHMEFNHKLLCIMRHIDALEGRLAASKDHWDASSQEAVAQISRTLRNLEASMASNTSGGLQRKVEVLANTARLKEHAPRLQNEIPNLDDASLNSVFAVLQQQAQAIASLQKVLAKDTRDLGIMQQASG